MARDDSYDMPRMTADLGNNCMHVDLVSVKTTERALAAESTKVELTMGSESPQEWYI